MIVTVEGLEPLAQHRVMVPWTEHAFEVWVCSQCPWHWLTITVQFDDADTEETLIEAIDPMIADWYIAGYNGDFGTREAGRFHYISDPELVGDRAVCYTMDLGRAGFDCIRSLMNRLHVLHTQRPIRRVLFGSDRLP